MAGLRKSSPVRPRRKLICGRALHEIVDRIFGQHVEESVERLAQRRVQTAAVDQRAFDRAVFEALGHRKAVFGHFDDVEEADLLRRFAEPDATVAAPDGFDQARLIQRLQGS